MDPRLLDRRQKVAEDRARSNLGRLLRVLVVLGLAAGGVWTLQSPFLSVARIVVTGASEVDVESVLREHEIEEGRPMVLLAVDTAQAALQDDVWVADAEVARDWPNGVVVTITERVPAATVGFSDGWFLVAADGVVLESVAGSEIGFPRALFPTVRSDAAGEAMEVAAAVRYVESLPADLASRATVGVGTEGLEATVAAFTVRLGRPFSMEEKAVVTGEILALDLEPGSILTVFAPASPAVLPPGKPGEGETEDAETEG